VKRVLNVGGGVRTIPLPGIYDGWEHVLLDVDPAVKPDIVSDARQLSRLPESVYDAVYCSNNLEHYHRHEVGGVLAGFRHVLKADGFADVRVPDLGELMRTVVRDGLDIDDFLYQSSVGPITVHDVIFGYGVQIEQAGNPFFAHKTGFTRKSLGQMLGRCGFPYIFVGSGKLEVIAFAFKAQPSEAAMRLLGLSSPPPAGPGL
jgi:hypothetical protein